MFRKKEESGIEKHRIKVGKVAVSIFTVLIIMVTMMRSMSWWPGGH